jgi:hypothetical protein
LKMKVTLVKVINKFVNAPGRLVTCPTYTNS